MNIWQGKFPEEDKGEDGYKGTNPVRYILGGLKECAKIIAVKHLFFKYDFYETLYKNLYQFNRQWLKKFCK